MKDLEVFEGKQRVFLSIHWKKKHQKKHLLEGLLVDH